MPGIRSGQKGAGQRLGIFLGRGGATERNANNGNRLVEYGFHTSSSEIDEQTGFITFQFTFSQAGTFDIGIAVLNEGDTLFDAGLLVDDVSITGGAFADGFETGLDAWQIIGPVTTPASFEGIPAPEGEQLALLLTEGGAKATEIEDFLAIQPGTLAVLLTRPVVTGNVTANDDFGPDGRARRVRAFADGFQDGMGLAFSSEGTLYLATRSIIMTLRDADGDDVAVAFVVYIALQVRPRWKARRALASQMPHEPLIVEKLRHHAFHVTSVRPYDYRDKGDGRREHFVLRSGPGPAHR